MKALNFVTLFLSLCFNSVLWAESAGINCAIQTYNGNYLTAVDGGGRTTDAIHSDATSIGPNERFNLIHEYYGSYPLYHSIQTANGHYLTAEYGGGVIIDDVISSDRTAVGPWEKFKMVAKVDDWFAIQTISGRFLSAVDGGGRTTYVMNSNAIWIRSWEMFKLVDCVSLPIN
jgi:hypothetical protein